MATIRDVARLANVSIATVSRVLNGSPRVSEESRRRVRGAALRLDYWPNSGARSLTTSRTQALGVLLPDLFGEFFSEVIRGIDHAAREEKLQLLVSSSHSNLEELVSAARTMRGRIDGLIAMVPDNGRNHEIRQLSRLFPLVLLNPRGKVRHCSTVSVANHDGAKSVVGHLLGLGHRRIAILNGPRGNGDAAERLRGYREALVEAGIAPDPELELQGDFTESSGFLCGLDLLRWPERPTAVFAANDYMAIGLLRALRDARVAVPWQMAVVGFDDIEFARYLDPPLTTVRVDAYALGERATRILVQCLGPTPLQRSRHLVFPATLAVRGSCGGGETRSAEITSTRRRRAPRGAPNELAPPLSADSRPRRRRVSTGGRS